LTESCRSFSPVKLDVRQVGGNWRVMEGSSAPLDFGPNEDQARTALRVIQYYKMDSQCFVGDPSRMQYYLVNGKSPVGLFPGEDCAAFNPATTEAKLVSGNWKVVDGSHWILDFGSNESEAKTALKVIQKYGFKYICFVGRPNAPMMYFCRDFRPSSQPSIS